MILSSIFTHFRLLSKIICFVFKNIAGEEDVLFADAAALFAQDGYFR